jgi:hypothetical protein
MIYLMILIMDYIFIQVKAFGFSENENNIYFGT